MGLFKVVLTSLGSMVTLFVMTKLMGYRQMAQLSMFDYVNGITIGSIAGEMATAVKDDFREPLIAMIVYGTVTVILSVLSVKSLKLRQFFEGKPIILYDHGELYYKNLKTAKMDLMEFMTQLRTCGYFDISKIQTVVLEANGQLSVLPLSHERPVSPSDLNIPVKKEHLVANVVIDGNIMYPNLESTGNDEKWLRKQLKIQGFKELKDLLLVTCDHENTLHVYKKNYMKNKKQVV